MEDELLRYGAILLSMALFPIFEIYGMWIERKEEREGRTIPTVLDKIFIWFETRSERRRKKREARRKKENTRI